MNDAAGVDASFDSTPSDTSRSAPRAEGSSAGGPSPAPMKNAAAVLHGVNDLRFEEAPPLPPRPPAGWVRIRVRAVGICRTDVHFLQHGRVGNLATLDAPMVIGHEAAGDVVEVGDGVQDLKVGEAVAIEPGVPCACSREALAGRYNLDPAVRFLATPPVHGALAQIVDHPAAFCHRLPAGLSHEQGAMCEPLSVGVHAARRGRVAPGCSVAVIGAGPIGLVVTMAAKAFGADRVAVAELNKDNLTAARTAGADACIRTAPGEAPAAVAARLKQALPPHGPEVVIDCVGFESTAQVALECCAPGGRVVLVGMGEEKMRVNMLDVVIREIEILGCFRYVNTYPLCVSMLAGKRADVLPMITHRFDFSAAGVAAGFDTATRSAATGAIKVMFSL